MSEPQIGDCSIAEALIKISEWLREREPNPLLCLEAGPEGITLSWESDGKVRSVVANTAIDALERLVRVEMDARSIGPLPKHDG